MIKQIRRFGVHSSTMYLATFASILLSIGVWFLRRGEDRPAAERLGIFIGLWAPTLWGMGQAIQQSEEQDGDVSAS